MYTVSKLVYGSFPGQEEVARKIRKHLERVGTGAGGVRLAGGFTSASRQRSAALHSRPRREGNSKINELRVRYQNIKDSTKIQ